MFSRARLEPGSERFEAYYAEKPEFREPDDRFRAQPGLLRKGSAHYDPFMFAAADASFETIAELHSMVDGPVASERESPDPGAISSFIKGWTVKLGATDVGITELRDYHKYTTVGRGEQYGQPVRLDHEYAIALTVEMAKEMIDRAPRGPTVMESAQQYLTSGAIAVQVAQFIRNLGYPARAHIDGNYRVVCPLVARDAGLGEIGRMGLLMTPRLGPRVRLGVVTTDLPLVPDVREPEHSVLDFCSICEKCADVCPSQSIARGLRTEIDGALRWQIDSESCFTYWSKIGTDCARCMSACPYSHPDNVRTQAAPGRRRGVGGRAARAGRVLRDPIEKRHIKAPPYRRAVSRVLRSESHLRPPFNPGRSHRRYFLSSWVDARKMAWTGQGPGLADSRLAGRSRPAYILRTTSLPPRAPRREQ